MVAKARAADNAFTLSGLIQGLLVHMFFVGLPIACSVSYFGKHAGLRTEAA
jgi:hypothetical protein